MEKLDNLPVFSEETYRGGSSSGARFMLFKGPDGQGYVRVYTEGIPLHECIVANFVAEIRSHVDLCLNPDDFHPKGGGIYHLSNHPSGEPEFTFGGTSAKYGPFDAELLRITLENGQPPMAAKWKID
jgi:hypothetical protein